jgi:hypothetical protein
MSIKWNDLETLVGIVSDIADSIQKEHDAFLTIDPDVMGSVWEVEKFIRSKRRIVYGGTALNAILSSENQFYDPDTDVPDWDFFTPTPIQDAMDLADILVKEGYTDVQVNPAVHHGTFKVFSSNVGVADITYMPRGLYQFLLKQEVIDINGIMYVGANFLRMSAYLELSRPDGDVSRWEKVMKRISLVNQEYPIKPAGSGSGSRRPAPLPLEDYDAFFKDLLGLLSESPEKNSNALMGTTAISFIEQMLQKKISESKGLRPRIKLEPPDSSFPIILSRNPEEFALKVHTLIMKYSPEYTHLTTSLIHSNVEFLGDYCIIEDTKTHTIFACILGTGNGCQAIYEYKYRQGKQTRKIKIASVETSLYLYFALRYADSFPMLADSLLESCEKLLGYHYAILRGQGQGLLPALPKECIGKQETLIDIRKERSQHIAELIKTHKTRTAEYYSRNIRYNGGNTSLREKILVAIKEGGRGGESRIFDKTRKKTKITKLYGISPEGTLENYQESDDSDDPDDPDDSDDSDESNESFDLLSSKSKSKSKSKTRKRKT